jgi:small ligand-binding sensory domain FIST
MTEIVVPASATRGNKNAAPRDRKIALLVRTSRTIAIPQSSSIAMDCLNSDLVLHAIGYLNVIDSNHLAVVSKRLFYLVQQYRQLATPEIVVGSSWADAEDKNMAADELFHSTVAKIRNSPNLVLSFSTPHSACTEFWSGSTISGSQTTPLPRGSVILGAVATAVQANCDAQVECRSNSSLMLASFSKAYIQPFSLNGEEQLDRDHMHQLLAQLQSVDFKWKAILVYCCGHGFSIVETFVSALQAQFPGTSIVGGICEQGFVTDANDRQRVITLEHGIYGVALGGDTPMRSVVSRGVISLTQGKPQPTTPWYVNDVLFARPGDPAYMFQGDPQHLHPVHMIQTIQNKETGEKLTPMHFLLGLPRQPDFIGLRRPHQDGFELHMMSPYCYQTNSFLIMTDGSPEQEASLQNANLDAMILDGQACQEHMEVTVSKLSEQTQGEQILGAVMFSCAGRGPRPCALIGETMADATRFANVFPHVPLSGFYAAGEIGPLALAGNQNSVFQNGRSAVQGFTAVFALFVVPVATTKFYHLDDSKENIENYVRGWLNSKSHISMVM